jgi:hypothetical protein
MSLTSKLLRLAWTADRLNRAARNPARYAKNRAKSTKATTPPDDRKHVLEWNVPALRRKNQNRCNRRQRDESSHSTSGAKPSVRRLGHPLTLARRRPPATFPAPGFLLASKTLHFSAERSPLRSGVGANRHEREERTWPVARNANRSEPRPKIHCGFIKPPAEDSQSLPHPIANGHSKVRVKLATRAGLMALHEESPDPAVSVSASGD